MITINGIEINIDFTDADIIEKIDQAGEKVRKKIEELEKNKKDITPAEGIRQECEILKEFLDYVIEDGISKKIFGDRNSLKECLQAFEDITEEKNKQYEDIQIAYNKYSPDRLKR